jgi:SNF2 family DNA or RNA helicase
VVPPASFIGELREFQKEGLSFLVNSRRCLLADEMGLGKTPQGLAFLAATNNFPALVICPPHLVLNWKKEIEKFLCLDQDMEQSLFEKVGGVQLHIIKGLKPYKLPPANIYIIHYLLLRGWKKYLPDSDFKAIIFDEIQELRHTGTEKYSAASLVAESTDNVIGLSGTPIYNHGGEIWNVLNILEYHCLGDYDSFTREWCNGYGSDIISKPDMLGDYLKREGLLLRRTKDEVLPELPDKRRVVQTIDFDKGIFSNLIQEAVNKVQDIEDIKNAFERGRAEREIINETRMATGVAKAKYVAAFVKMLLEAGEKVLLVGYHHAVVDIYKEELREFRPGLVTGRETLNEKDKSVTDFMEDKTNLVIISLRSASGLNLYKANCVVFGELDWSPAVHSQAEDRAHRIGQQDSVLCYYLVCEEGTDEAIQNSLGLKVSQFIGLMGDKSETQDDRMIAQVQARKHMQAVIEKLKGKKKGLI